MMGRRNTVLAALLVVFIGGMTGLSFAAVPLYRMFCQATGYNGTPQIGASIAPGGNGALIEVRFDANTSPSLPWRFTADQPIVHVPLGEDTLASYSGRNQGKQTITGIATYNVSPDKAAQYFHKTACFCFNEQTLTPGQVASFPLSFWVDPAILTDPDTRDVKSITLSYTFFRSLDDAARNGGLDKAGPHVGARADATAPGSGLNPAPIQR